MTTATSASGHEFIIGGCFTFLSTRRYTHTFLRSPLAVVEIFPMCRATIFFFFFFFKGIFTLFFSECWSGRYHFLFSSFAPIFSFSLSPSSAPLFCTTKTCSSCSYISFLRGLDGKILTSFLFLSTTRSDSIMRNIFFFRGRGGGGCRCIGSRRPAGDRLIQCARMATITFNPIDSGNTRPSFKVHTTLATRENKRKCMCDAQRGVHHRSS